MVRPFTPQADILGDLPDRIIYSIFEYIQHGDSDNLVLPFTTKLEESEGVTEGLTEDEFFFLLDLYEGDGDQLLSDCLIIEQGVMGKSVPGKEVKADPGQEGAGDREYGQHTKAADLEIFIQEPPKLKQAVSSLDDKLQQSAKAQASNLGKEYEKFHQDDIWYRTIKAAADKANIPGVEKLINGQGTKEKRALDKISLSERRHLVKVNRLVRELNLARSGRDIRALKKQISIEKRKMDAEREVQYRLFMRDRKKVLEFIRKEHPGFWRGFLFGKEGMLKPDYGIGVLQRLWRMARGAVVGWEKDVDAITTEKLKLGRMPSEKEQKMGITGRVPQRRVPGAVQWVFGQKQKTGARPGYDIEPLEGIRANPKVGQYMSHGGAPGAIWRGTGFTLFGKRFYTGEGGKREIPIPEILHPWAEKGVVGPEARRAMKIFMKDIKAVDAEIWRLNKDIKHSMMQKPAEGVRPYKDTETYYQSVTKLKELKRLRNQILKNKGQFMKYAKAAKTISSKLRKGKLKTGDITSTMKPLIPVLAAALVAAGVMWFKARHSREMLRIATNKVLQEAGRKGMMISAADVRKTVDQVVKNPVKIRKITHAIELAKAGVAVERAASLLADLVIVDLGINKMPSGGHDNLLPEPTESGHHTGQISAVSSLEPFSF